MHLRVESVSTLSRIVTKSSGTADQGSLETVRWRCERVEGKHGYRAGKCTHRESASVFAKPRPLVEPPRRSLVVSTYQAGKLSWSAWISGHWPSFHNFARWALLSGRPAGRGHSDPIWFLPARTLPGAHPRAARCLLPRRRHAGDIHVHDDQGVGAVAVNTKFSCLCTRRKSQLVPRWRPPSITGRGRRNRCYLNGWAPVDGDRCM